MSFVEKTTLTESDRAKVDETAKEVGLKVVDYAAAKKHFGHYNTFVFLALLYASLAVIMLLVLIRA